MQEVTEDNIEEHIKNCSDPDALKELITYAVRFNRDDLVEQILERSIQGAMLVEKLRDTNITPQTISFADLDEDE